MVSRREFVATGIGAGFALAQVMTDLDSTFDWVGKNGGDISRAAITGYCWGGRVTWLYSAHNPKLKAGIAWYGHLVGSPSSKQKPNPVDEAAKLTVPVLGLYGGKDSHIPLADIERMRAELKKGKTTSRIIVYDEAEHGFHADYRPTYRMLRGKSCWTGSRCMARGRKSKRPTWESQAGRVI